MRGAQEKIRIAVSKMSTKNTVLNTHETGPQLPSFRMHDEMKLGAPTLRIRNLQRMLDFYEKDFGLRVNRRYQDTDDGSLDVAELGFDRSISREPLLILKHDPNATKSSLDSAGLYHFAVLLPDRKSLASTYLTIGNSGVPYDGFANHLVSESLYLRDPERNGIEIYSDRPRNEWPDWTRISEAAAAGDFRYVASSFTQPLDLDSLLRELTADERVNGNSRPFPRGAKIGHMHLKVTNLERSVQFYHEKLGLDIMGNLPSIGAAFLSAGGYHHHIGLNTWHSLGGDSNKEGDAGLENFTIIVPDRLVLDELRKQMPDSSFSESYDHLRLSISDPDGIRILIESAHE